MKDISPADLANNINLSTRSDFAREVNVGPYRLGGKQIVIIAGPCTVESKTQMFEVAQRVKDAGAHALRGGVFKPLTFPYGDPLGLCDADRKGENRDRRNIIPKEELFQSAEKRLAYFKEAGEKYGLPVVSEVLYSDSVSMMSQYVDMFQVGYRHMFNMDLIEALSEADKPILLKRHYGESLRSLLGVAEHFDARGKSNYAVCERGIVVPHTHNVESRSILDVQAIPAMKDYAPTVPIVADPSHSTFKRSYVAAMSRAAIAAGADGLLIEVHPTPEQAWVDPLQALSYDAFAKLVKELDGIARVLGRTI